MRITIFGLAGTGTSTVGKLLAEDLGFKFMSSGNIFREMAAENGMNVYEFNEFTKKDSKFDIKLDGRVKKFGLAEDDFIFESRLAWNFIPHSVKIKLDCSFDERIRRVIERDSGVVGEVSELTLTREKAELERYNNYYNIEDYTDNSHFDLVIDTTSISIYEVISRIKKFVFEN